MSLFRKIFYRKPPDGLLEISERVYVFDSCYATGMLEDSAYKLYIGGIVGQLQDEFLEASFMVFNFRDGENQSQIAGILCDYDMTVMDYPRQYEGCPLLTMEMINHFLRSSESWLSLGQQNVVLMHCERGGWPILAFMLAALLIYRKQFTGEQKTLDMIYKQAPPELLQLMSPVNPLPSQIRYLQYVSRRNVGSQWPPLDRALTLDCIILRFIPNMDGEGGCCPIFRIYGQDPLMVPDKSAKVLFATPKRSKLVRYYKQTDCELVKIDIHCHIQGDVVLECISLDGDLGHEAMVFRVVFNTAFIRSNILMLNRDEIDILWNAKDQFPQDFRAEVLFSEMDAANSVIPIDLPTIEDKDGLPVEEFSKVQEIFSTVDWLDPKTDVALNVLQHLSAANLLQENTSSPKLGILLESAFQNVKEEKELKLYEDHVMSPTSHLGKQSIPSMKTEPQDMQATLLQPVQYHPSLKPPIDSNTIKNNIKYLEVQDSPKESIVIPPKDEISVRNNSEPKELQISSPKSTKSLLYLKLSTDERSNRKKTESKELKVPSSSSTQDLPSCKPSTDEPKDIHVSLQLPSHSNILSPRLPKTPISARISHSNSLQGSSVPLSRYHSAPSALGITALLRDHAVFSEETFDTVMLPSSSSASSSALINTPKSLKLSNVSSPSSVPPPPFTQSSSEALSKKASVLPPPLSPCSPLPPPSPPLPSLLEVSKEIDAKHPYPPPPPTSYSRRLSSNSTPPPPPPLLPCFGASRSPIVKKSLPSSPPPPPSLSGISPSSVKNSFSAPLPPPPPLSDINKSAASSCSSQLQTEASVPPPPPSPQLSGSDRGSNNVTSAPAPPPPPVFASRGSLSNNSTCAPPVPPPPASSAKGMSKDGSACLQPYSSVNNGKVLGIPGPPSAPLNSKGRGLSRPGARNQAQIKKANLKPYHWLKLTRAMQGSLWAEAQKPDEASKAPEIDMSELESLFSAAAPDKIASGKSDRHASSPKSERVQLIELRRAYNCEIMLSKVKIPLPELMSSVLVLDDSALDVDQVENLIKFCPTKEEMELLKGYNGDKDNLGKCEQFFLELMKAPRIESKLRVFSFKIQFHSQVYDLRKNLNIVNSAADEVKDSVKLKRIMQTILTLGNALNHGTARGSAIGFRLDSLLKLTDTRARNNKMTLMHYLCKLLAEKLPELLDFPKDLVSLEAATKIQLKYLAEEMQAISKGLEKVVQELTASENDGPVSELFCKTLNEFLSFAEGEVRSLASLYSSVGRNADALALYFGEDPARCPFEQVVSTLLNFVRMFVQAHDVNCKQLELEKKKAQKNAENKKPKVGTPKKESQYLLQSTINSRNVK